MCVNHQFYDGKSLVNISLVVSQKGINAVPVENQKSIKSILFKCAGVDVHSFRSHIKDYFDLEWKSMLKRVESTLKRMIQPTTLEWIPL